MGAATYTNINHCSFDERTILCGSSLSIVLKDRLTEMISDAISDETETGINLPISSQRNTANSQLRYWIDNAFLGTEYAIWSGICRSR